MTQAKTTFPVMAPASDVQPSRIGRAIVTALVTAILDSALMAWRGGAVPPVWFDAVTTVTAVDSP